MRPVKHPGMCKLPKGSKVAKVAKVPTQKTAATGQRPKRSVARVKYADPSDKEFRFDRASDDEVCCQSPSEQQSM